MGWRLVPDSAFPRLTIGLIAAGCPYCCVWRIQRAGSALNRWIAGINKLL